MANLEGLTLGNATKADAVEILGLLKIIHPTIDWDLDRVVWQFFDTPRPNTDCFLLRDQERLIAMYTGVAQNIRVGSDLLPARMIQDVMTHPDYRRRGILNHLSELSVQQMREKGEVGYTFPKNPITKQSFNKFGWQPLCNIPWRKKQISESVEKSLDIQVDSVAEFDQRASQIWQESGFSVGIHRDANFLNWRYSKPGIQYFPFMLNKDQGLLVLKLYQKDEDCLLHICELLVKESAKDIIPAALQFCEFFGAKKNAHTLTAWQASNHPYGKYFDAADFKAVEDKEHFIYLHNPESHSRQLMDANSWHFSQGDSDVY